MIRNPLGLCHISHISGGKHPPIFTALGKTLCGACRCRMEVRQGADAELSYSYRVKITMPSWVQPSGLPTSCSFLNPPSSPPTQWVHNQPTYPPVEDSSPKGENTRTGGGGRKLAALLAAGSVDRPLANQEDLDQAFLRQGLPHKDPPNCCVGPLFLFLHGGGLWQQHIKDPDGNDLQRRRQNGSAVLTSP